MMKHRYLMGALALSFLMLPGFLSGAEAGTKIVIREKAEHRHGRHKKHDRHHHRYGKRRHRGFAARNFGRFAYVIPVNTDRHRHHVDRLPIHYRKQRVNGKIYYHDDGVYYRKCRDGYDVVSAPFGAVVSWLPGGSTVIRDGSERYYRVGGTYYRKVREGYMVVDPYSLTCLK